MSLTSRLAGWRRALRSPGVPRLSPFWRLASAPLATFAVFLVQEGLNPSPGIAPFAFFATAVVVVTWLGGRLPGLLTVALSALTANYAFVAPRWAWSTSEPALWATLFFTVSASIVALMCAAFRESLIGAERATETLRRQAAVLELSDDAIMLWHPVTGIESWSQGAERIYGYTAAEVQGRLPRELLKTIYPIPLAAIEAELREHGRWEGELVHTGRDGRRVDVWTKWQRVRLEDDLVLQVNRDITTRKGAEAAQQRGEALLRAVLAQMPSGLTVRDVPSGELIIRNARAEEITGGLVTDAGDLERYEGYRPDGRRYRPEELPVSRAMRGETVAQEEVDWVRPDGTHAVLSVGASPVRDAQGRIVAAVAVLDEITERKRVETALRTSEESFRTLANAIPQLAWMARPDGYIEWYNDRWYQFTGTTPKQMEGWGWQSVHDPRTLPRVLERWKASIGSGAPFEMEFPLRGADGRFRRFLTRVHPLQDDHGRVLRWFGTNTDVTELVEVQQQLRRERDFSSAIMDVAGALVLVLDAAGRITRFNRACELVSGYAATEVLGRHHSLLIAPEERDAAAASWEAIRRSGAPNQVRRPWQAKDGSRRLVDWSVTAVLGGDGQVEFVVGTGLDVTERQRAEEQIRRLNESLRQRNAELDAERMRWQGVVEGIAEEVWVCDAQGRMTLINLPESTRMGLEPFEDRTIGEVVEDLEIFHPDGTPRAPEDAPLLHSLRTGEIARGEEVMRDRRTGRMRHRQFSCAPTRDAAGAITGAVAIVRDITDRKQAEDALRDSEATLDAFFRASSGILIIADEEFRCIRTDNLTPSYYGLTRESIVGKSVREIAPEIHEQLAPMMREVMATGIPRLNQEVQGRVPSRPGELTFWRASFFPVPLAGGRSGIGVMGLEITDIKKAEHERERLLDEMRGAERSKNEFLAVLSHELRNPLAPIRNSLYILDRAAPGGEHARRALQIVDRQVTQLTRLVDDLLDVNRISRGKIRLHREPVLLDEVVRRISEDLHSLFDQAGVRLEVELASGPLWVDGDPARLSQIINNLLQNAAKFTSRGGWARVSLWREDERAVVLVQDNGAGIEPQLQGRLFDTFVQGERTLDRARGGLGLGLALVKGLAELHDGTVSVRSAGLGAGAAFTVELPLMAGAIPHLALVPRARRPGSSRILVIEDNLDTATSLREALALNGHAVEIAQTGPEGLARARADVPDVVLCDVGLPGMDGHEVARALRADPRFDRVLLVALSGYALPEDVERSEEAGFDRHLAKPPNLEELERLLTELPDQEANG